jgi:hypothetical protein
LRDHFRGWLMASDPDAIATPAVVPGKPGIGARYDRMRSVTSSPVLASTIKNGSCRSLQAFSSTRLR